MISTDVMISDTICCSPPATHHTPHGRIQLGEIGSVFPLESELENQLGGVQGSLSGVYLGASGEHMSSRLGVYNGVQSGMYFRVYLGASKDVHLAV